MATAAILNTPVQHFAHREIELRLSIAVEVGKRLAFLRSRGCECAELAIQSHCYDAALHYLTVATQNASPEVRAYAGALLDIAADQGEHAPYRLSDHHTCK